ncbi:MAG TPA: sigma factor-like helix-turn-helix DNA-binding protein [Candidatus Dormibacteraeota bacterium]
MDQVHVEAPVLTARAASVEREFYLDFPLVLNYVARLLDDIDGAAAITCAAFRQVGDGLRHRSSADGLRRAEVFRAATELSRLALRPKRWFRRQRAAQVTLEGFPQPEARRALRRDTVQRALTALPFEARAMVLLRDFVKLSYDELAEVVDVAPRKLVHALDRSRAEFGEIYDYIKF